MATKRKGIRAFTVALVAAFVIGSAMAYNRANDRQLTASVAEYEPGLYLELVGGTT